MARDIVQRIVLSPKLVLVEIGPGHGDYGWWLWDECRGMNLAIKAKTEREAFTKALEYYQKRLNTVLEQKKALVNKVETFVEQFIDDEGLYTGVDN